MKLDLLEDDIRPTVAMLDAGIKTFGADLAAATTATEAEINDANARLSAAMAAKIALERVESLAAGINERRRIPARNLPELLRSATPDERRKIETAFAIYREKGELMRGWTS